MRELYFFSFGLHGVFLWVRVKLSPLVRMSVTGLVNFFFLNREDDSNKWVIYIHQLM